MNREALRKQLEKEARQGEAPICPCGCGKRMVYKGFIFFDDPCKCGSGKKAIDCCYKDKAFGGGGRRLGRGKKRASVSERLS